MKILVACEKSQTITKELRKLGHEAYSCDIAPCSGGHPEWHIRADVTPLINGKYSFFTDDKAAHYQFDKWDMIIAFPPCAYLTNAAAWRLWKGHRLNKKRYTKGLEAKEFFMKLYNADCEKIAIENPVPNQIYGLPEKTQIIRPCMFGHPFIKGTQLWLKGLPLLKPTKIVKPKIMWCPPGFYSGKYKEKNLGIFTQYSAKIRNKTFPEIAEAMAKQWAGINVHE